MKVGGQMYQFIGKFKYVNKRRFVPGPVAPRKVTEVDFEEVVFVAKDKGQAEERAEKLAGYFRCLHGADECTVISVSEPKHEVILN